MKFMVILNQIRGLDISTSLSARRLLALGCATDGFRAIWLVDQATVLFAVYSSHALANKDGISTLSNTNRDRSIQNIVPDSLYAPSVCISTNQSSSV